MGYVRYTIEQPDGGSTVAIGVLCAVAAAAAAVAVAMLFPFLTNY